MNNKALYGMIAARDQASNYRFELDQSRRTENAFRHSVITAIDQALLELDKPRLSKKRLKTVLSDLKTEIT